MQKGLTDYCFKYIDRPFCLQPDDLYHTQPIIYLPWYRTHTNWAISSPRGEYSTHVTQVCRQLEHNTILSIRCTTLLGGRNEKFAWHFYTGNRTVDLLILSPTPYPLGHMQHNSLTHQTVLSLMYMWSARGDSAIGLCWHVRRSLTFYQHKHILKKRALQFGRFLFSWWLLFSCTLATIRKKSQCHTYRFTRWYGLLHIFFSFSCLI